MATAYKAPSARMAIKLIFCRLGIWSLLIAGMGRMSIAKSVDMFRAAFA